MHIDIDRSIDDRAYASRAHAKHDLPVSEISGVGVILEVGWEGVKKL